MKDPSKQLRACQRASKWRLEKEETSKEVFVDGKKVSLSSSEVARLLDALMHNKLCGMSEDEIVKKVIGISYSNVRPHITALRKDLKRGTRGADILRCVKDELNGNRPVYKLMFPKNS